MTEYLIRYSAILALIGSSDPVPAHIRDAEKDSTDQQSEDEEFDEEHDAFLAATGSLQVWSSKVWDLVDSAFKKCFTKSRRLMPHFGNLNDPEYKKQWDAYVQELDTSLTAHLADRVDSPESVVWRLNHFLKRTDWHAGLPLPSATCLVMVVRQLLTVRNALVEVRICIDDSHFTTVRIALDRKLTSIAFEPGSATLLRTHGRNPFSFKVHSWFDGLGVIMRPAIHTSETENRTTPTDTSALMYECLARHFESVVGKYEDFEFDASSARGQVSLDV